MNAAVVQNPDGTSGVIVEEGCSAQNTSVAQAAQAAAFGKPRADPFKEQDQVAMAELMKMNDQFAEALDTHGTPDKEFLEMLQQDASDHAAYETYTSFQTASHEDDRALQASVQQFDAQVQQAVAAYAAGPNPVLPQDPALAPTQGMDWLERMRAEDAALRAAMESNDAQFRPPKA